MKNHWDPPPDSKLAKDMARLEQQLAQKEEENPMKAATDELEIVEAVVSEVSSRPKRPSFFEKFYQCLKPRKSESSQR